MCCANDCWETWIFNLQLGDTICRQQYVIRRKIFFYVFSLLKLHVSNIRNICQVYKFLVRAAEIFMSYPGFNLSFSEKRNRAEARIKLPNLWYLKHVTKFALPKKSKYLPISFELWTLCIQGYLQSLLTNWRFIDKTATDCAIKFLLCLNPSFACFSTFCMARLPLYAKIFRDPLHCPVSKLYFLCCKDESSRLYQTCASRRFHQYLK